MMIKAVIFDMDGLLIDSEPFWQVEEKNAFAEVGIDITTEMQKETYGLGTKEVVQHWYNYKPWQDKKFDDIRNTIIRNTEERVNNEGVAKEGVYETIDFFKKKGIKIGLASSSPMHFIETVVNKLDIKNEFASLNSAETAGYSKPHPAVFINAAKNLSTDPLHCLVIEDSFHGLIAAKAARMKTIVVPDETHHDDLKYDIADLKIKSLTGFGEQHFEYLNNL